VKGRVEAGVVLEVLRGGHWNPSGWSCAGGPQHITWMG
jgi:hypothetical protein